MSWALLPLLAEVEEGGDEWWEEPAADDEQGPGLVALAAGEWAGGEEAAAEATIGWLTIGMG